MSLLKLQNIGKIYDSNDILTIGIRGINLEFDFNEFVTIEGESGSGKSTLLNVIAANDSYEEGELYFNNLETSHFSENEWELYREQNIAMIFQDFNIIENLTVLENVELALLRISDKEKRRNKAKDLIQKVGLTEQINRRGSKLSGGEKQRTVIARALAKDSPIILADEPTGNLDIKNSIEVAALLKEVSKDKLVIVVTHNPEFFKEYATRRIRVYDGSITEDIKIEEPKPLSLDKKQEEIKQNKYKNLKNTLHIGLLNYKSRPKFTITMTLAMFICAITLFLVIQIFGSSLINNTKTTLDDFGVDGKVILSNKENNITQDDLDLVTNKTKAGFYILDRELSEFTISIPKTNKLITEYEIILLYSPYEYNLESGNAVLKMPASLKSDSEYLINLFKNAEIGIQNITLETTLDKETLCLYLSYDDLMKYGYKMKALYSSMTLDTLETYVYTFTINEALEDGYINLVNSNYYEADKKTVLFSANTSKSYTVLSSDTKNENYPGLTVEMSESDYNLMFLNTTNSVQSVLYFETDSIAKENIKLLPENYIAMISNTLVYKSDSMNIFTQNIIYYLCLICACILFAMIISLIFTRSVKIYQADFAVYRTLGISRKISSKSLYFQMFLIFIPTLILLPLVSLITTSFKGSTLEFISFGNYLFIELLMILIVEFVAFSFNKTINSNSIRKSLRRGSK